MEPEDYYSILGVPPAANLDRIREAYRKLSSFSHPDLFAGDPAQQRWANERMKQINQAYSVLSDPAKRSEYDRSYSDRRTRTGAEPWPGRPEEQFDGLRCPACEGEGETLCLTCGGSGNEDCPGCRGRQYVTCPACHGAGTLAPDEYERLVEELLQSESRAQATHVAQAARRRASQQTQDPFWQPGYWDRPQRARELRPAAFLSFLIPGAGQLYNREPQKAATYFGIAALLFLGIGLLKGVGLLLFLGFWVYNIYDAHTTAERQSEIETRKGG